MRLLLPLLWLVTAALLAAAPPSRMAMESLREQPGCRFSRLDYTTVEPCATRVLLRDGELETTVSAPVPGDVKEHRILLPLATGRLLRYSILLPGGARTAPRTLRAASSESPRLAVWQESREDGTIELAARTSEPARWSIALRDGTSEDRGNEGANQPAAGARFGLPSIGLDGSLESITVKARFLDCETATEAGPILGGRRLARTLVERAPAAGFDSGFALTSLSQATAERFSSGPGDRLEKSGLARLLRGAARRLPGLLTDRSLDAEAIRIPLSLLVGRAQALDRAVRARGWPPAIGFDGMPWGAPGGCLSLPEGGASLFKADTTRPATLEAWPPGTVAPVAALSHVRLSIDGAVKSMAESVVRRIKLPESRPRPSSHSVLALPFVATIDPRELASAAGRATIFLETEALGPATMLFLRINDQAMLPFGGPGSPEAPILTAEAAGGLLRPGRNTFVLYAIDMSHSERSKPIGLRHAYWAPAVVPALSGGRP